MSKNDPAGAPTMIVPNGTQIEVDRHGQLSITTPGNLVLQNSGSYGTIESLHGSIRIEPDVQVEAVNVRCAQICYVQGSLTAWKVEAEGVELEETARAHIVLQETDRLQIGEQARLVGNFSSEKELFLLFSRFTKQLRTLPLFERALESVERGALRSAETETTPAALPDASEAVARPTPDAASRESADVTAWTESSPESSNAPEELAEVLQGVAGLAGAAETVAEPRAEETSDAERSVEDERSVDDATDDPRLVEATVVESRIVDVAGPAHVAPSEAAAPTELPEGLFFAGVLLERESERPDLGPRSRQILGELLDLLKRRDLSRLGETHRALFEALPERSDDLERAHELVADHYAMAGSSLVGEP